MDDFNILNSTTYIYHDSFVMDNHVDGRELSSEVTFEAIITAHRIIVFSMSAVVEMSTLSLYKEYDRSEHSE